MSKRTVSRTYPCPACGKADWCCWFKDEDGERLRCMRGGETPDGMKPIATDREGGRVFVHEDVDAMPKRKPPARDRSASGRVDAEALYRGMRSAVTEDHLQRLGQSTGLDADLWRVLFAMPAECPVGWSEDNVSKATSDAMSLVFDRLFELPMASRPDGELIPEVFTPTNDAKSAFVSFNNRIRDELLGQPEALRAAWSKLRGYAARLALVHHLIRAANEDPTLVDPDLVDEISMRAGIGLAEWFGGEARRVYARLSTEDDEHKGEELLGMIRLQYANGITPNELHKARKTSYPNSAAAEAALNGLVLTKKGRWIESAPGTPGRPTRRFRAA